MAEAAPAAARPHGAFGSTAPFLAKAPPLSLPMRHFLAAAAAFWIFAAAFAWGAFGGRLLGFDFQAGLALGLVHTLALGWITMTLFGAMSQMAPVLWEVSLAAPEVLKLAWWLFAGGIAGFVGCFWAGLTEYWIPAVFLAAAVSLYLYCFLRTMASARQLDWTAKHLALSSGYLAAVAVLGLMLAFDRERGRLFADPAGALIAHVHLALIGWVSVSIVGVSYRLVSMFSLSHMESKTPGRLALVLINIGLLGLAGDALFMGHRRIGLWAAALAAGYLAYAFQMRLIFKERSRRIDPALAYTLAAVAGGFVWAALGLGLAFGWLTDDVETRAAYVFCAFLAWVTPFILGQIHKIVPFLIWLHVYSKAWKPPLPLPKIQDLTSERLAWFELGVFVPGVYAGIGGFLARSYPLLRLSSALLLAAATLYAINVGVSLRHAARKDPRWTTPSAPS